MGTEALAKNVGMGAASEFISDVHRTISPTACLSRLRDVFNEAIEIPTSERKLWLQENIGDPEERQAVATLLHAYDSDGFIEGDAD